MLYTATLSFANKSKGFAPGGEYEMADAVAKQYVELGWLVPVAPVPAKKKKAAAKPQTDEG